MDYVNNTLDIKEINNRKRYILNNTLDIKEINNKKEI